MPVTSFKIPEDLLAAIDRFVASSEARNRTEVVITALESYVRLQMQKWRGAVIITGSQSRAGIISRTSLARLFSGMSEKDQYEAGRRMGITLKDSAFVEYGRDITQTSNHPAALKILQDFGWGSFEMIGDRIVVLEPLMPSSVLHGYLETALGLKLICVNVNEDAQVFSKGLIRSIPEGIETT